MKQLSGTDHLFLQLERGNQYMHVAGLGIYDPSTAPGGKVRFKDVLRFFEARFDALPVLTAAGTVRSTSTGYWIRLPHSRVPVRHVALRSRRLTGYIQVARITRALDHQACGRHTSSRLDHIPACRPALAVHQVHHCAVDGEAGTEIR
jgi:hypothetical protein